MAASYPTSAKSFSTKATTNVVEAAHINDIQDEVTAIETALLTGGVAHNVFPSGTRTLGTSSAFWDKGYVTALILGAETTSGIRVEVNAGSLDVREGDDSASAPMSASVGTFDTAVVLGAATTSGIRLEVNTGICDVREGDDSALAPLRALTLESSTTATVGTRLIVTSAQIQAGTGSPEGAVTGSVGDLYLRRDGGAGTTLYIKESGAGNTGWVAK